jgi:hypothetical protein
MQEASKRASVGVKMDREDSDPCTLKAHQCPLPSSEVREAVDVRTPGLKSLESERKGPEQGSVMLVATLKRDRGVAEGAGAQPGGASADAVMMPPAKMQRTALHRPHTLKVGRVKAERKAWNALVAIVRR